MSTLREPELSKMRSVEPSVFDLKTPLLSAGMTVRVLCRGEQSSIRVHCYSTGMGEKHGLHAHVEEEHAFIVLHGAAVFTGIKGPLPRIEKNQGIWLPKGCFYEFFNPGPEPLVVLRTSGIEKGMSKSSRITPEGEPIPGRATQFADLAVPKIIENACFE